MNILQTIKTARVEWKTLGEVASIQKGKQLNKTKLKDKGLYPAYNGGKNHSGWTDNYNVERNTIIISQGGASAGFVNFITTPFWANAHCYYFLPNFSLVENRYLYHFLKMNEKTFMENQHGAGIPALSQSKLENFKIPIPPLALQQQIVAILDKFTALVSELQSELNKELTLRQKQYHYYRDLLLTFDQNHDSKRGGGNPFGIKNISWKSLGEVGDLIRGNGLQKKDFTENGVSAIHYGQIYTYYGTFADKTKSFVSAELAKKLKKAQYGDVLIAGTSENVSDVMKPLGWLGGEIVFSGDMFAFRPNDQINTKFLTYLLQTTHFQKFKERNAQGTKVIRVNPANFLKFQIPIPPLSTQAEIVAILDKFETLTNSLTDGLPREIELRQKQYEYYREKLLNFDKNDRFR